MTDTRNRGRRWLTAIGGLAALALTAGIIGATTMWSTGPKDLNGNTVAYDPDASPNPNASATPNGAGRFVASSVNLDVPLGSLDATDWQVTPPGFTSAYLIRNYGVTPDSAGLGAVYVVMHSLRNGGVGPGNALINVEQQKARIRIGATIRVGGVTYRVTGTEAMTKKALPSSDIWLAGPNELVVITCLQRPEGGPSVDNIVIKATRAS